MSTVLFLMLPATSHYISCLPLAEELKRKGYAVLFAGSRSGREVVEAHDFTFVDFQYMSTYSVQSIRGLLGSVLAGILNRREGLNRFRQFINDLNHFNCFLDRVKPDVILIDEHLSHYYAFIKAKHYRAFMLNTKLPSGKYEGVPPLNNNFAPADNRWINRMYCEWLWLRTIAGKQYYRILNKIAFFGLTTESFHKRFVKRSGMNITYTVKSSFTDYDNVVDAPVINLMSAAFNFPWMSVESVNHTLHYWNKNDALLDASLANRINSYKNSRAIIYCGIGTMPGKSIDSYARFFVQLIHAVKKSSDYFLIISTGVPQITNMIGTLSGPDHIIAFDRVSQQALLKHCDLMITHAGLNSVKECIEAAVPMLAVCNPAHDHTDTRGNSARIVFHQIGMQCNIDDKASKIKTDLAHIIQKASFKENILALRKKIEEEQRLSSIDTIFFTKEKEDKQVLYSN